MVTCKELILDFLADYLDATLSPEVTTELEQHLEPCPPAWPISIPTRKPAT
jgi:hypothetical protein